MSFAKSPKQVSPLRTVEIVVMLLCRHACSITWRPSDRPKNARYHWLPVVVACGAFVAAMSLAMALTFFFAAFLPADFSFLRRMAFFVVALRFLGIETFLSRESALTLTACLSEVNKPLAGARDTLPREDR